MKNNVLKYYIVAICLCSTFIINAQPGSGSDTGTLETPDPAAPINDYIVLLALVGLGFVFLKLRSNYQNRIQG